MQVLRFGVAATLLTLGAAWPRWALGAAPLPPAPIPAVPVVSIDGVELLSVTARAVSLSVLIAEIAQRAGFTVTGKVSAERRVSVEFTAVPLDQALKRLLRNESFIFLTQRPGKGSSLKLQRVIFVGSSRPAEASIEPAVYPADETIPEGAEAFNPDGPLEPLLLLTAHHDPRMRTAALEALTLHTGDERARRTLMEDVSDPDPHIRAVALGLLGPFVTQWSGAEEMVMMALQDPAPEIRQLALLTLSEASSSRAHEALHEAVQDSDPRVRTRAEELLRDRAVSDPIDYNLMR